MNNKILKQTVLYLLYESELDNIVLLCMVQNQTQYNRMKLTFSFHTHNLSVGGHRYKPEHGIRLTYSQEQNTVSS